jgi:CBS domain-containing protein
LLAFTLAVAKRRGIPWTSITGTSNQSDYISHFIANHMFYRLSLPGARRVLLDHIEFCRRHVPGWNPVSVVGQHMQQAGATPVETMAFTISTALQYAQDFIDRGMDIDVVLRRFTFFFDISISFFEEVAKFRAGRRIWARLARERLGAKEPASWRFKFHAQTSGVDLTEQQPLNNIARVAVQAMAGIMSGLQSLHTDAYDEAITTPTEETARIAVATQNILREEAHLCDVIDPLGDVMDVFLTVMRPLLFLMSRAAGWVLRALGSRRIREGPVHSPDELKLIVTASRQFGEIPPFQEEMIHHALELDNITVREVMVPRPAIFSLPGDLTISDALSRVVEEQHSRVPVYDPQRGHTLYNDAIRVPLIIVAPGYPDAQVISEPVSLLDVATTVLALAGGSPEPSFGRKLFIEAQASISVPSTEKCSLDNSFLTCGKARSAARNSCATSVSSSRSRLCVNTVGCHTAASIGSPTNQRNKRL